MDRQAGHRRLELSTGMDMPVGALDRALPVFIVGHRGLVGSALLRKFQAEGFTKLLVRSHSELDLTDRAATFDFVLGSKPQVIIDAAAKVGGIMANNTYPADFCPRTFRSRSISSTRPWPHVCRDCYSWAPHAYTQNSLRSPFARGHYLPAL